MEGCIINTQALPSLDVFLGLDTGIQDRNKERS